MKKVTLNYDEVTGNIYDQFNGVIISWPNLVADAEVTTQRSIVNDIKELKSAGFTAEEIMQMKREGVI